MIRSTARQPAPGAEHARFLETFRRCLAEQGYGPGQRVPRGAFAVAVFRSSRAFTQPAGTLAAD